MNSLLPRSLFAGLVLCCASGGVLAHGTLNLTGSIRDSTCALSQDSKDFTVSLGSISRKQFSLKGDVAQSKDFGIKLENCGKDVKSVRVTFSGTPDADDATALALEPGGATGIGVQILDGNMNPIKLTEASLPYPLTANASTVTLNFNARYITTHPPVSNGPANASGTFVFNYD